MMQTMGERNTLGGKYAANCGWNEQTEKIDLMENNMMENDMMENNMMENDMMENIGGTKISR